MLCFKLMTFWHFFSLIVVAISIFSFLAETTCLGSRFTELTAFLFIELRSYGHFSVQFAIYIGVILVQLMFTGHTGEILQVWHYSILLGETISQHSAWSYNLSTPSFTMSTKSQGEGVRWYKSHHSLPQKSELLLLKPLDSRGPSLVATPGSPMTI